jgi:hypothetical protein
VHRPDTREPGRKAFGASVFLHKSVELIRSGFEREIQRTMLAVSLMTMSAGESDERLTERLVDYRQELVSISQDGRANIRVQRLRHEIAELEAQLRRRGASAHRNG